MEIENRNVKVKNNSTFIRKKNSTYIFSSTTTKFRIENAPTN